MKGNDILEKFRKKFEGMPLPDLSKEDQYLKFSEALYNATRKKIEDHHNFVARTSAAALDKPFG
ncbi:MAG: hypothetical protein NT136_00945 [Candidatus Moranbacteria bacterium]|nr:hypothetical protein [Candidatus Moranbacteria bacterium]